MTQHRLIAEKLRRVFVLKSMFDKVLASTTGHRFVDRKPALEGKAAWNEQELAISWF